MLHRLVRLALLCLVFFTACVGPPAPDAELCRDVIERLCAPPACSIASTRLGLPAEGCVTELVKRTGCDDPGFTFTTPSRERVLDCRLPLVRESIVRGAHPSCDYVDESFRNCPDLVNFLGGAQ